MGIPFGNVEIFPSYSTTPTYETRTLNRICIAVAWFVICAWATNKLGWWNHIAAPDDQNQTQVQLLILDEESEESRHGQNEDDLSEQERYEQYRQEAEHDVLEAEAHVARTTTFFFLWNDLIMPYFVLMIMLSRWGYAFYDAAAMYGFKTSWKNYFVFMFGEVGWWDVGTVVCVVVAWVSLHFGEVLNVEEEREFHVWIDEGVRGAGAWVGEGVVGFGKDLVGVLVDGMRLMGSMMRDFIRDRDAREDAREWNAWEVEERERRQLGLPVRAPRGGWMMRR